MPVNVECMRSLLREHDFTRLMVEELGWNNHVAPPLEVQIDGTSHTLEAVAEKSGMVVYTCHPDPDGKIPIYPVRQKIERQVAKTAFEHLIIFADNEKTIQFWQWVKRQAGKPAAWREQVYRPNQTEEPLLQKLQGIAFEIEEEEKLSIAIVTGRVQKWLDVEKVTKKFYDRFKTELETFLDFVEGISDQSDQEWYASLMLNRLMFVYFIQKRGFLDGDLDYLRTRLRIVQEDGDRDRFQRFYRLFLLRLFHEGLGQPEASRAPDLAELLGDIPFLNGGLFDVHELEHDYPSIHIPDDAFVKIFDFFDDYTWHLDERPLRNDKEVNPDVLGYIFEKYVNQKQMGAYYSKEDITGYISRNTVIPSLFDSAIKDCPVAFRPEGGVWRLLADNPDRYIYPAMKKGVELALPKEIADGISDTSKRAGWNQAAPEEYALPTETWREVVARRTRYEEVWLKLADGEIHDINELVTLNLDIDQFAQDVIINSEGPELVKAFWNAIEKVTVLDPTCGSGAFLFAALNVLEPLYTFCLEAMQGFLDDLDRSAREHHPLKLKPFRDVLLQVEKHPSRRYFVLKSIVINNLYGVDIMEEAVEICKLRLFLKIVAQVERVDQIEPLPDIDFNIRAGNTLVGFTSLERLRDAMAITPKGQHRMLSAEEQATLGRIEEDAEIADRAFLEFHLMQTEHGMDAEEFAGAKSALRRRLDVLRDELDLYLASEYRVDTTDQDSFEQWRASHQPFHWFVEFYGIMQTGGFDVIFGNPPYVEYRESESPYCVKDYLTLSCRNLYCFCVERSGSLLRPQGYFGMIVPLSGFSTLRMKPYQDWVWKRYGLLHVSYYSGDAHPSVMFNGVKYRLSIVLGTSKKEVDRARYFTDYQRWYAEERGTLFDSLRYEVGQFESGYLRYAKCGGRLAQVVLKKISERSKPLSTYLTSEGPGWVNYHRSPVFWIRSMDFEPYFNSATKQRSTDHLRDIYCESPSIARRVGAILNSTIFFFWFTVQGNCRNIAGPDILEFPAPDLESGALDGLEDVFDTLMSDLRTNSRTRVYNYSKSGRVEYQEFYPGNSKPIIDEIDRILAGKYDLTEGELDFIINYDIKYRLGQSSLG